LEEEFKKEIDLKQLSIVYKKMSGLKNLHHTLSQGEGSDVTCSDDWCNKEG
jgi:hypothetical protein